MANPNYVRVVVDRAIHRELERIDPITAERLDPNDSHNQIITDIQLGKDPDGMVRYEASWTLTMPTDSLRRAASCGTTCQTGAARSRS